MSPLSLSTVISTLLCLLISQQALSLPDDREQAIVISADKALRDEKKGRTVYSGNVVLDQGSLHISADRITVFRINTEGDKIVAKGQPALVQQKPSEDEELMRAHADVIEYFKDEDRLRLQTNAQIEQGGSTVKGNVIDYFITLQLVKAGSDKNREDSRVIVVIPANKIEKTEGESGKADGK